VKQMLYCEEAKHTFPNRGDTITDSSVEYVLPERETERFNLQYFRQIYSLKQLNSRGSTARS